MQDITVTTSRGALWKRGLYRRDLDLGLTHPITVLACFAFGTIRLWYDITVFAAVLSFHSARYRSCDVKTACMLSYICEIPAIYTTSYTATI